MLVKKCILMEVEGKFKGEMGQFYMLRAWDKLSATYQDP